MLNIPQQQMTLAGNTTGTLSLLNMGTVTLAGGNKITLSQAGNVITVSAANIRSTISMWPISPEQLVYTATIYSGSATATNGTNTTLSALVIPMALEKDLAFNNLRVPLSCSLSTGGGASNQPRYSQGLSLGVYSLNGVSLSLVSSWSNTLQVTMATNAQASRGSIGATMGWDGSTTNRSTGSTTNWSNVVNFVSGSKILPLNWTSNSGTLTAGQYWVVIALSHSTQGTAFGTLQSFGMISNKSYSLPPEIMKSTGSSTAAWPFQGIVSLVISSDQKMPNGIQTANLTTATNSSSNFNYSAWFQFFSRASS